MRYFIFFSQRCEPVTLVAYNSAALFIRQILMALSLIFLLIFSNNVDSFSDIQFFQPFCKAVWNKSKNSNHHRHLYVPYSFHFSGEVKIFCPLWHFFLFYCVIFYFNDIPCQKSLFLFVMIRYIFLAWFVWISKFLMILYFLSLTEILICT